MAPLICLCATINCISTFFQAPQFDRVEISFTPPVQFTSEIVVDKRACFYTLIYGAPGRDIGCRNWRNARNVSPTSRQKTIIAARKILIVHLIKRNVITPTFDCL